jgi:hypothetical protein
MRLVLNLVALLREAPWPLNVLVNQSILFLLWLEAFGNWWEEDDIV